MMADNLQSLVLESESEMVQLKATESWLDRSSDAPKREIHQKSLQRVHRVGMSPTRPRCANCGSCVTRTMTTSST